MIRERRVALALTTDNLGKTKHLLDDVSTPQVHSEMHGMAWPDCRDCLRLSLPSLFTLSN